MQGIDTVGVATEGAEKGNDLRDDHYQQLKQEFQDLETRIGTSLSFGSLEKFLSLKAGVPFDSHLLQDLFNKMNKGAGSLVSADDFIRCYIDAELILTEEIASVERELEEYIQKLGQLNADLEKTRSEVMTSEGIMKDSHVEVDVVEAQNLSLLLPGRVSVVVDCSGRVQNTSEVVLTPYIRWDQHFSFPIKSLQDQVQVQVVVTRQGATDTEEIGHVSLPLQLLKDQRQHEDIYDIGTGKLRLTFQWVWNTRTMLADSIEILEESQRQASQVLVQLNRNFSNLRAPFKSLSFSGRWKEIYKSRKQKQPQHRDAPEFHQQIGSTQNSSLALILSTCTYATLSIFSMFFRPDFPNVFHT